MAAVAMEVEIRIRYCQTGFATSVIKPLRAKTVSTDSGYTDTGATVTPVTQLPRYTGWLQRYNMLQWLHRYTVTMVTSYTPLHLVIPGYTVALLHRMHSSTVAPLTLVAPTAPATPFALVTPVTRVTPLTPVTPATPLTLAALVAVVPPLVTLGRLVAWGCCGSARSAGCAG